MITTVTILSEQSFNGFQDIKGIITAIPREPHKRSLNFQLLTLIEANKIAVFVGKTPNKLIAPDNAPNFTHTQISESIQWLTSNIYKISPNPFITT